MPRMASLFKLRISKYLFIHVILCHHRTKETTSVIVFIISLFSNVTHRMPSGSSKKLNNSNGKQWINWENNLVQCLSFFVVRANLVVERTRRTEAEHSRDISRKENDTIGTPYRNDSIILNVYKAGKNIFRVQPHRLQFKRCCFFIYRLRNLLSKLHNLDSFISKFLAIYRREEKHRVLLLKIVALSANY